MEWVCRMFAGLIFCLALAVMSGACSTQQVVTAASVSASLATVKADYEKSKAAIQAKLATMPSEEAEKWKQLINKTDAFKVAIEEEWGNPTTAPSAVDATYAAGAEIYAEAYGFIKPRLHSLPLNDQILLRRMNNSMLQLAEAYKLWKTNPELQRHAEAVATGVELAKLALQVAAAIL